MNSSAERIVSNGLRQFHFLLNSCAVYQLNLKSKTLVDFFTPGRARKTDIRDVLPKVADFLKA